jgi:hypothetical protein
MKTVSDLFLYLKHELIKYFSEHKAFRIDVEKNMMHILSSVLFFHICCKGSQGSQRAIEPRSDME